MPGTDNSDGSIIIDTGLDTKGFDKGSKELLSAINSLTKEVNQLGKTLEATFSNYGKSAESSDTKVQQLEKTVQTLEVKVKTLNTTIADLESQLEAVSGQQVIDPDGLTQAGTAAGDAETQIADLENRIQELESVAADLQAKLGEVDAQNIQPTFSMDQPRQSVSSLETDINKLGSTVDSMSKVADAAIDGDAKALDQFDAKAEQAQDTIDGLRQRLEAFGNTEIQTDDYKWVQAEIVKADNALQRLLDRQDKMQATGVKTNSKAWKSLQYDIDQARQKLDDLRATQQIFENEGNATIHGFDTAEYEQYVTALNEIEARLSGMQDEVDQAFTPPHVEQWNQMVTLSGAIRNAFISAFDAVRNGAILVGTAVQHPFQTLDRLLGAVATSALRAAGALLSIAKGAVVSGINRIATAAKNAAKNLLQMFTRQKQANGGFKSGLSTILKYGLGIRSVYVLFNKLRSAIKEGFGNLAQFSDRTNASISSVMSALAQFKNSIAAAFDPILRIVAPIITKLINLLTLAATKLGEFFAALTGQKSYIRAVEVQKDYAASLNGTAEFAKTAADRTAEIGDAAEEAKRQLASFDDVEILEDASSTSNPSGSTDASAGSGGIGDAGNLFEEVPVDPFNFRSWGEGFSAFLDTVINGIAMLKGAFGKAAAGINEFSTNLLEMFTFSGVQEKVIQVGADLADAFNYLVASIDWNTLGAALGAGFNLALLFLVNLIYTFDWLSLGRSITDSINGFISQIDWYAFGQLLMAKFKITLELFAGLLENLDMAQLADAVSKIAIGMFDSMTETIASIDWEKLGEQVKTFLVNLDWNGIAKSVFTAIGVAFGALTAFLWGLLKDAWQSVVNWWHDNAEDEDGNFIIEGLWEGIKKAVSGAYNWIKENIFRPFIEGFKKVFGINSPSTVMAEQGGYIVEGLLQGLTNAWSNITSWMSNIASSFFNWGADICAGIANGIASGVGWVIDAVGDVANWIASFLHFSEPDIGPLADFHTYMPDMLDEMAQGIKSNESTVLGTVSDLANAISDEIQNGEYSIGPINAGLPFGDEGYTGMRGGANPLQQMQTIANTVAYKAPQVSLGGLVPYSVAAENRNSQRSDESIDKAKEDLISVIIQSVNNATIAIVHAIEENGGSDLPDIDRITSEVIRRSGRQTLMKGGSPFL